MDMRISTQRIRSERKKRAWSQEHLAEVSGLGIRTVHRIEKTGIASLESIKALASVFELEVLELQIEKDAPISIPKELTWTKILWILLTSPIKLISEKDTKKANILRLLTILVCSIGAIGSYFIGFSAGIGIFVIVGAVLEIAVAFKLTEVSRTSPTDA